MWHLRVLVGPRHSSYVRRMQRRIFLAGAATVGAGLAAGLTACDTRAPYDLPVLGMPALLAAMGHERILAIGRAYMSAVPDEGTAAGLQRAVASDASPWPWSRVPALEQLVASDFEAQRIVLVDGWMLSVTEARQCALYALAHG